MNQISRHIFYLLLTCRKVSVPGLGSFYAIYDPAAFNASEGVFYPSKIRINFSEETKKDSDLLIKSLERKLNLKENEASLLISEFISEIKNKLNERKYCRLEGIGYLIKNQEQNITLKDTFWKTHKGRSLASLAI